MILGVIRNYYEENNPLMVENYTVILFYIFILLDLLFLLILGLIFIYSGNEEEVNSIIKDKYTLLEYNITIIYNYNIKYLSNLTLTGQLILIIISSFIFLFCDILFINYPNFKYISRRFNYNSLLFLFKLSFMIIILNKIGDVGILCPDYYTYKNKLCYSEYEYGGITNPYIMHNSNNITARCMKTLVIYSCCYLFLCSLVIS